jgi:pyruvate,water dikinase
MSAPALIHARDAAGADATGGKAATLARLAAQFAVPDFFVIPADAFADGALAPGVETDVVAALAALGPGPYAVRSSAREEDGARYAHAGQYLTELGVPAERVSAAAARVWASGFAENVARYRAARGLDAELDPPAVIVQRMIEPRAAGIAFSADPVTGEPGTAVVSAVAGRADRLAAGELDGETYRVSTEGEVTTALNGSRALTDDDGRAVAALARAVAARLGAPQDIEWAFDGDALYLLQARPITTLAATKTDEAAPAPIWDNSNIVESYPGVVAPLTLSFARYAYAHAYRAFARLMGVSTSRIEATADAFDELLGRIDGRVYYNLLNWYRVLALFPGFKANRAFMEQMMGVGEPLPAALALRIAPPAHGFVPKALDTARLAAVGLGLVFHALALERTSAKFRVRLAQALAVPDAAIDAMSAAALAAEYRRAEALLLTRWDAPLINDFLCMIAFGASRKALESWAGADGLALHGDVLIGQGDIVSAEPARRIRAMGILARAHPEILDRLAEGESAALAAAPALAAEIESYVATFGDRCVQELKLESPTLHEDPSPLLKAVAAAARAPERAAPPAPQRPDARLAALFAGRPVKRALAGWLLARARARVRDRENLRFERTRLFGRVRRVFRALGRRLGESDALARPEDVFYLTVEEALAAAERGADPTTLKASAARRRAEDAASLQRPDPPERIEAGRALAATPADVDARVRQGIACCSGVATGRARVILDPRAEALAPGEILVARSTDPGWIAAFANAAGVITERGSLLSHSAIVAREMGIPCVVALKGATDWLKSGDLVRLDGGAGSVERLAP